MSCLSGARHHRRPRVRESGPNRPRAGFSESSRYPLARIRRPFSRLQSRFFSDSRLSCSFLPLATASKSLARPRSLKYSLSGISVMPSRSTAPISLLICFLCSSNLRGRPTHLLVCLLGQRNFAGPLGLVVEGVSWRFSGDVGFDQPYPAPLGMGV